MPGFSFAVLPLDAANESVVAKDRDAYALYVENDSRNIGGPGSDQSYTNGVKFSYIYAQGQIPVWSKPFLDRFYFLRDESKWAKVNYGLSLGQQIFTPNNTQTEYLVAADRPYAAWLYAGFGVSLKEKKVENFLELNLGTVGSNALGEQVQNGFHVATKNPTAKGWNNGLKNEPTLQVFYQKRHKTAFSDTLDFIPYYGAALGNVLIGGHVGGLIRFGPHLPDDFGPSRPSASDGNSFISTSSYSSATQPTYDLFGGLRGNYVNKNIFLDGNSYQESHWVKKHPFNFETELGFSLYFKSTSLVWRFVTKSPEFEDVKKPTSFASIGLVYTP